MNTNENVTLSPGDEDLIAFDAMRARKGARTFHPGSWGFDCPRDPFTLGEPEKPF